MPVRKTSIDHLPAPVFIRELEESLALTRREATIFLSLITLGETTVQQLARAARTERTGTYDVLRRLADRGVVLLRSQGKKTTARPASPETLRAHYAEQLARVDAVLPKLRARYGAVGDPTIVSEAGAQAVALLMERLLAARSGPIRILVPLIDFESVAVAGTNMDGLRVSELRLLVATPLVLSAWQWLLTRVRHSSVRVVSNRGGSTSGSVIAGDSVLLLSEAEEFTVTAIDGVPVARAHERLFDAAWATARRLPGISSIK